MKKEERKNGIYLQFAHKQSVNYVYKYVHLVNSHFENSGSNQTKNSWHTLELEFEKKKETNEQSWRKINIAFKLV